ncbi:cation diffusion facilitator family transporter [Phaeobacter sp.]|uniref:cation diffusion facilitator family transporter n=1 Tax=Phaeobacter sp. TaxID=1902409 RepID=UPI0025F5A7A8|nr:cation diffusion facilitator family transporter [Phaeobacter sp.]
MTGKLTAQQLAGLSVLVACVVLLLKTFAWWMTGSIALFSDALESLVNIGSAAIAWLALRYARRPADRGHPFGHHKAEYFSAVLEGILIIVAALLIVQEAAVALFRTQPEVSWAPLGLWVNAVAMAINLVWARVLIARGRLVASPALTAGGRHLMTDVWTSAGVLVGLVIAILTGLPWLDPLLALVIAANILWEGYKVVASSIGGLMDEAAPAHEQAEIESIIHRTAQGALQVHGLKTRRAGQAMFVEFHLVVSGNMTVRSSHAICDRIEEAIRASLPTAEVTIHVEPEHKREPVGLEFD